MKQLNQTTKKSKKNKKLKLNKKSTQKYEFMKQKLGTSENAVAPYVSLFWASLMIGRWTSAAGAFNLTKSMKTLKN
jgi:hypothetical protein